MFNRRLLYVLLIAPVMMISLNGCKKFLDTSSPTQLNQNDVLSTEQGFKDALTGVYLQMGSPSLYGKELTFGFLSVLSRSYDTTMMPAVGNLYYEGGARYNFQHPDVLAAIKNVWDSTYQCIAGLNNIISESDARQNVFTGNNYYSIKAEAIALRAYLHFDLLRMFGPANISQNLSVNAIPYVKTLSPYAIPVSTTGSVIDSCIADLLTAKSLMKDSSKVSGHLNYWGVKGLLARAYMYKGDLVNAQLYATQLISNSPYALNTSNADALFVNEHLFSIYVYQNNVQAYLKSVFNTGTPLGLLPVNQTALYVTGSGSTADWRKNLAFLDPSTNSTSSSNPNAVILPKKLGAPTSGGTLGTSSNNYMPMIRLSEMYYIAAECAQLNNNDLNKATTFLDTLRVHRNLPSYTLAALPTDSLTTEIRKEYMKDLLGEGQVFYYFKRKNLNIATLPFTKVQVIPNATYVFPKPE